MLNQLNKPFAIYLLEPLSNIPKYFYTLRNLTWASIRVHKTKSPDPLIA